jgi:hypothetical protein
LVRSEGRIMITVKELKELIKNLPEDYPVLTEGCDCEGPCNGIELKMIDDKSYVVITRDDSEEW